MHRQIATALLVMLAAAASTAAQHDVRRLELPEFQKLHAAGKILVVDVRDEDSFANGHIPGAINIPLGTEDRRLERLRTERRPIVAYCA